MTRSELKQLFKKYNVNQKVVDSYLKHDWLDGYSYNDLENEIVQWSNKLRAQNKPPLSDEYQASVLFMYLTTD